MKDDYADLGLSPEEIAEFDNRETIDGLDAAIRGQGSHKTYI